MTIYNPSNLPKNDNLNRFAFVVDVADEIFIRKGKMIAFYGQLQFESLGSSLLDILVKESFNSPLYINNFIVAKGRGQLILGDNGNDIACYDLEDANMTIKASHLLGFSKNIICQESTMPGFLTLMGNGKLIASSNGPVHFLDLPCRVDEQAILGWADCPSPSYRYDYEHVTGVLSAVGAMTNITLSGEEKQIDFSGQGTVLIQSSEFGLNDSSTLAHIMSQLPFLNKSELNSLNAYVEQNLQH
ncbi:AIM24 family protein [Janthinobacterium sp. B9-8]|uniref:AIM24 family protein n=1 Tax=Janthinobacterium sp. B9-8 TaxID=1236179 RepID=UPI00061D1FD6|nr:AIM24 family protein [Janthinobacterium sp. B9-8]AMC36123.1 Ser or Arg-related nuclear matrix protein [Janthinobacterium sp. B9-8]